MGQYYAIFNPTIGEKISTSFYETGIKAREILYDPNGAAGALAALLSAAPDNRPGDLPFCETTGRWAGHAISVDGDYGEPDDFPGCPHRFPTGDLYSVSESKRPGILPKVSLRRQRLVDIGEFVQSAIEAPQAVRLAKRESLSDTYYARCPVQPDGNGHFVGSEEWITRHYREAVDRPPRGFAHDMSKNEIADGQKRLWLNLDRREYIDPRAFGEVPTTAGIVNAGYVASSTAVMAMLFHAETRGGGDFEYPHGDAWLSRWRGQPLALSAETATRSGRRIIPPSGEVLVDPRWLDVSAPAKTLLEYVLLTGYISVKAVPCEEDAELADPEFVKALFAAIFRDPFFGKSENLTDGEIEVRYIADIPAGIPARNRQPFADTLVFLNGKRVFLHGSTWRAARAVLDRDVPHFAPKSVSVSTGNARGTWDSEILRDAAGKFDFAPTYLRWTWPIETGHDRMTFLSAVEKAREKA